MPFVLEFSGIPDVASTEVWFLNVLLDLYPAVTLSTALRATTRLTVDGDVLEDIKSYSYQESENQIAGVLNLEIADLADRVEFVRDSSIKFEVGIGAVPAYTTLVDTAKLSRSDYNLANQNLQPADTFSLSCQTLLQSRMDITPLGTVVLYDPAEVTITDEDLMSIPDIDGVEEVVTTVPIADMNLGDVFDYIATALGFTAAPPYITNIPTDEWKLRRVDFNAGSPYWGAIAGIIGNHEPILDISDDDELIIRDGTADVQPDASAARELTIDHIQSLGNSSDFQRFKGTLLTYQEKDDGWDYWTERTDHPEGWFKNVVGQYPHTYGERVFRDYFRTTFPNTPVKTELKREHSFTESDVTVKFAASAATYTYSNGQVTLKQQREFGLSNVPTDFAAFSATLPAPVAGFSSSFGGPEEFYTGTSAIYTRAFVLLRTTQDISTFSPHPHESDSIYRSKFETETRGLIVKDVDNPQLTTPYEQPLAKAEESGNLVDGQDSRWGTTDFREESQAVERNRNVNLRTQDMNNLVPSGLRGNYDDPRVGDIGISVIKPITRQVYIYDEADEDATLVQGLNGGEAPLTILRPLVIRRNRRQFFPANVSIVLPTLDLSIKKGRVIEPRNRAGTSFGIYRITGFTHAGAEGKHITSLTARQIG